MPTSIVDAVLVSNKTTKQMQDGQSARSERSNSPKHLEFENVIYSEEVGEDRELSLSIPEAVEVAEGTGQHTSPRQDDESDQSGNLKSESDLEAVSENAVPPKVSSLNRSTVQDLGAESVESFSPLAIEGAEVNMAYVLAESPSGNLDNKALSGLNVESTKLFLPKATSENTAVSPARISTGNELEVESVRVEVRGRADGNTPKIPEASHTKGAKTLVAPGQARELEARFGVDAAEHDAAKSGESDRATDAGTQSTVKTSNSDVSAILTRPVTEKGLPLIAEQSHTTSSIEGPKKTQQLVAERAEEVLIEIDAQRRGTPVEQRLTALSSTLNSLDKPTIVQTQLVNTAIGLSQSISPIEPGTQDLDTEAESIDAEFFATTTRLASPLGSGLAAASRLDMPRHLAAQFHDVLRAMPDKPVEISLHPEELGKVRMSVTAADSGVVLTVLAERNETLDLLKRHADQLSRELAQLGFGSIDLAFGQGEDARPNAEDHGAAHDQGSSDQNVDESEGALALHLGLDDTRALDVRL